jgi:hypothetical protein
MRRVRCARSLQTVLRIAVAVVVASPGCANLIGLDNYEEVEKTPMGRSADTGGNANTGGNRATGGRPPAGGASPTGGISATGGVPPNIGCDVPSLPNPCRVCLATRCAVECRGCRDNPDCSALLDCINDCAGTDNCLDDCVIANPDGEADFFGLFGDNACAFTTCKLECAQRLGRPGEACDQDSQCASSTCLGPDGWCSTVCTTTSDCAGGLYCVPSMAGESYCFVGCGDDLDCSLYPGTTCQQGTSTDGASVAVCAG